jgi:hypothetical protein
MKIYFDMDGTIADLYANPDWLSQLRAYNPEPYATARPLVNLSLLARRIHQVQKQGHQVGIISWLSKETTEEYNQAVTQAKLNWLRRHLPSVTFDSIDIIPYGQPKWGLVENDCKNILFDDERKNTVEWICQYRGFAYTPDRIFEVMEGLLK